MVLIEQPSILFTLSSHFNCHSVDPLASTDGYSVPYYLKTAPNTECYTPMYFTYLKYVVLPALFIWAVVFPLMLAVMLYKIKTRLDDSKIVQKFGSLYTVYQRNYYYWGLIQMGQKCLLVIFAQLSFLPGKVLGLTLLGELVLYKFLIQKFEPYRYKDLNKTDEIASYVFILTIFLMVYGEGVEQLERIATYSILLINLAFILFLLFKIIKVWDFGDKLSRFLSCTCGLLSPCISCLGSCSYWRCCLPSGEKEQEEVTHPSLSLVRRTEDAPYADMLEAPDQNDSEDLLSRRLLDRSHSNDN